jgi:two-component system cell cycle sensor histidine kinase/response regulator CckA
MKDEPTDGLRQRAEAHLPEGAPGPRAAPADVQRLVHELQVHQIELELQNAELLETRARLEQALARYTELYESAPIGYLTLQPDGTVVEVNRAGAQLFGLERDSLLSRRLGFRVCAEDRPHLDHYLHSLTYAEAPTSCQLRLAEPGTGPAPGTERTVQLTGVRATDTSLRVMASDITHSLALEAQLRQSQKMEGIGRLAGGVAHDFNNILTVILNYASFVHDGLPESSPLREDVGQIVTVGERAAALTRQLLAFSRKQVLQPKVLELNRVLADLALMLRRLIGDDIELVQQYQSNLGLVRVDQSQIEQVLVNLAVNARDAMPNGGRLTIRTADVDLERDRSDGDHCLRRGAYVAVTVTDTGIGIDEATAARVFEPFFTTKTHGKGTGLGLATVYGIAKQSGGSVTVESQLGSGATFCLYLPRESGSGTGLPAAPPTHSAAPAANAVGTILLVEDEPALRLVLKRALYGAGYSVLAAASGADALAASAAHPGEIALLLTDVLMPRMSGPVLAAQLVLSRPETAVLYMSGYPDDAIAQHGVLEAGTEFIGKPFSTAALLLRIEAMVSARPSRAGARR